MSGARDLREYAADGVLVLGGAAAILLQLADPVVARGVAEHSSFARDPLRRLRSTLSYVYAVGLGSEDQALLMSGMVDRRHAGIPGAQDPTHQLWVAATLHEVGRRVHELVHGPLVPAVADEVYAAGARLGTLLQLPEGAWPATRSDFARYWTDAVAGLSVGESARATAHELLHSRALPWWTRPAMPLVRTVTAGLLPTSVRIAYGLPDHPLRFRAAIGVVAVLTRVTPRRLRELPSRRLLAGLIPPGSAVRPGG
jgi:uncharacterized protein (DUF2236 family)